MKTPILKTATILIFIHLMLGCTFHRGADDVQDKLIYNLSRDGFIQELIFPEATPRTIQFDDYTHGSYHVDKQDLFDGIKTIQEEEDILGAVITGPFGPLWAYDIILFISIDDNVQMNRVVFPHARITHKATRLLSNQEYSEFMSVLINSDTVKDNLPDAWDNIDDIEMSYGMIIADWSTSTQKLKYSIQSYYSPNRSPDAQGLDNHINSYCLSMTTTYAGGLPEGYSIHDDKYIERTYGP